MKREVILGQLRELLSILGALCFAMLPAENLGSIVGATVAAVAIIFALLKHDGVESVFTLVRKFLSLVPAILVQFNLIDSMTAGKLIAFLAPASALIWSYLVNAGIVKGSMPINLILLAIIPFFAFTLPSCQGYVNNRVDTTGARVTQPDNDGDGVPDELLVDSSKVTPELSDKAINEVNRQVTRIIVQYAK